MIEFQNVSKRFGTVQALDHIDLTIDEGKIVGLFGPNGAGKSTMMKIMAGVNRADTGTVSIGGQTPRQAKEFVSYLPEIDHFYPWWTLKEAAYFLRAFYGDWDQEKYGHLLEFLKLQEDMKLGKISKGQRAKCKILLAVSRNAHYLLMDEPFSGIDILTREEIARTLIQDFADHQQTMIISTHEIGEIEAMVDQVIFLDQGQICLEGEAEELRNEWGLSMVGIMKEVFRHANSR